MPRVSIVIPAHNAEEFIGAALTSVAEQTFTDWEVVAIDDGSSDATSQILSNAGSKCRAFRNATPVGPGAARNRALGEAAGELIVFLDADDMLKPRYLERQLACYDASVRDGRKVGLVTCDAYLIDDGELASYTYRDLIRDWDRTITLDRLLERNSVYISSLVPRSVGEAVGWFDPELFCAEDYGLWLKILERGYEAVRNPEALAVYRRRSGSLSADVARLGMSNRRACELAIARGALSPRQRRIAKRSIRYNRAMEAVAAWRFSSGQGPPVIDVLRLAPLLAWVAVTNLDCWRQWLGVLRSGRVPPSSHRR